MSSLLAIISLLVYSVRETIEKTDHEDLKISKLYTLLSISRPDDKIRISDDVTVHTACAE